MCMLNFSDPLVIVAKFFMLHVSILMLLYVHVSKGVISQLYCLSLY